MARRPAPPGQLSDAGPDDGPCVPTAHHIGLRGRFEAVALRRPLADGRFKAGLPRRGALFEARPAHGGSRRGLRVASEWHAGRAPCFAGAGLRRGEDRWLGGLFGSCVLRVRERGEKDYFR